MQPEYRQQSLFGGSGTRIPRPAPLARTSDPVSSHIAAATLISSGRRDSQESQLLAWLRSSGSPLTSKEIAKLGGFDRHDVARRLPGMARKHLVERCPMRACRYGGTLALTWRATSELVEGAR